MADEPAAPDHPAPATSALEIARAYRTGTTTPTEVVDAFLERIDSTNDTVGAFVTVTAESARAAAREATRVLGTTDPARLPELFGVPTAIKDLNATAGVRTMYGSATLADYVPSVSDEVVLKLERAGMISLGKTNTPEFGSPCYTESDVAPPARTPYDLSRGAGGSSGGAAAAVATGLVPVAHGSDGGGSIRIPASSCGLVGLKPSRGRITMAPTHGDITGLPTSGALALTVRDAAAVLDTAAGPVPGDVMWARELPEDETYLGWCDRSPGRLRVGRFSTPILSDVPVDPLVLDAYESTAALLAELGHDVVEIGAPLGPDAVPAFETVWSVGAAMNPVPEEQEHLLRPLTRWLRGRGEAVSGPEFAAALMRMGQAGAHAVAELAPYDAVLTPTLAQLPAPVGALSDPTDPAADFEAQKAFTPYTAAWNVTGMPALSLPTAWSPEGIPIGTMLAGRPGQEHVLCALGSQVEEARSTPGTRDWSRPKVRPGEAAAG